MKKNGHLMFLIIVSAVFVISVFFETSHAHDLVWPGEKLKALFPQAESFEQKYALVDG